MADFKHNYFQRRTKDRGPRSNNRISSPDVQVITSDGENLGVLNTNEAIDGVTLGTHTLSDTEDDTIPNNIVTVL